jgi:hypothetical protein
MGSRQCRRSSPGPASWRSWRERFSARWARPGGSSPHSRLDGRCRQPSMELRMNHRSAITSRCDRRLPVSSTAGWVGHHGRQRRSTDCPDRARAASDAPRTDRRGPRAMLLWVVKVLRVRGQTSDGPLGVGGELLSGHAFPVTRLGRRAGRSFEGQPVASGSYRARPAAPDLRRAGGAGRPRGRRSA